MFVQYKKTNLVRGFANAQVVKLGLGLGWGLVLGLGWGLVLGLGLGFKFGNI